MATKKELIDAFKESIGTASQKSGVVETPNEKSIYNKKANNMKKDIMKARMEVFDQEGNVIADSFGLCDKVKNIYELYSEYIETYNSGVDGFSKIFRKIECKLAELRDTCGKNRVNLICQCDYPRTQYYDEYLAYLIYDLENGLLITASRSVADWYTMDELFETLDYLDGSYEYFIDPEVGVGNMSWKNGIVRINNFGALDCIPGALRDFLVDFMHIYMDIADYLDSESA